MVALSHLYDHSSAGICVTDESNEWTPGEPLKNDNFFGTRTRLSQPIRVIQIILAYSVSTSHRQEIMQFA